jgi:hypothetical protein
MAKHQKTYEVPGQSADSIYQAISEQLDAFLKKTPLGDFTVEQNPAAKTVSFKAGMASGSLLAQDGKVAVDVKLSLLASPFKGKIDEGIQKWLQKAFPNATT